MHQFPPFLAYEHTDSPNTSTKQQQQQSEMEAVSEDTVGLNLPVKHEPLDLSRSKFRLLKFEGGHGDVVSCSMRHVDINERPRYRALSYAWGPESPVFDIICNGQSYTDSTSRAITLITEAAVLDTEYSKLDRKILRRFMDRSYWSRLWIAQELTASPNPNIRCGSHHVNRAGLSNILQQFAYTNSVFYSMIELPNHSKVEFYMLQILFKGGTVAQGIPLHDLYKVLHDSHCANPRDKLYGLMPMFERGDRSSITVDYAKSIWEVYFEIVTLWRIDPQRQVPRIDHILPLADVARSMLPDAFTDILTENFKTFLDLVWFRDHDSRPGLQPWLSDMVAAFLLTQFGWKPTMGDAPTPSFS